MKIKQLIKKHIENSGNVLKKRGILIFMVICFFAFSLSANVTYIIFTRIGNLNGLVNGVIRAVYAGIIYIILTYKVMDFFK